MRAFIGTYTNQTESNGIYVIDISPEKQVWKMASDIPCINPSFLCFNRTKSVLYAVQEVTNSDARLLAFQISEDGTRYTQKASLPVGGSAPCHISLSPDGTLLIVSNYMSGNFAAFSIDGQGIPVYPSSNYQFNASSIHPVRQKQSHIHSAFFTPDGKRVFIQDLGGDLIYQFDVNTLLSNHASSQHFQLEPGAGPRHICFSNQAPVVYIMNELQGTIDVCSLNEQSHIQIHLQKVSLNSSDTKSGADLGAHIQLSADGQFLYATNRGDRNSISVYQVMDNHCLKLIQQISSGRKGPRFFTFSPDQQWLFTANQYSNSITLFERNNTTGMLEPNSFNIEIPSPVCIQFI